MSFTRCTTCARRCGADRTRLPPRTGCHIGRVARLAATGPERLEFAGCPLGCLFCPTPAANRQGQGSEAGPRALADALLAQQAAGAARVALVHPSHVAEQILEALVLAPDFRLPLVWVSAGFDGVPALALLDGRIAAYRPEMKFGDDVVARTVAGVAGYGAANRAAVAEMLRQVGPMRPETPDRGVLVRHRVLPDGLAGTARALAALPEGTPVQVLDDYRPHFRADRHPRLNRAPTAAEIAAARRIVRDLGLRLWP
jgi:putative pyruvate formate lyase activating enzyme